MLPLGHAFVPVPTAARSLWDRREVFRPRCAGWCAGGAALDLSAATMNLMAA